MSEALADDALSVWLGNTLVGHLRRSREGSTFVLEDDYRHLPQRPVLGQVFEDNPTATHWVRQGVPTWFANLLPEGPLRTLIAERANVHESRGFFLLELLGLDLPGAVVVIREGDAPENAFEEEAISDVEGQPLKFSLAGVQIKFSAVRDDRGLTVPAQGRGGDWIVKLPDRKYEGVPENEYSMMQWARASGIDVPEVDLVPVGAIEGVPDEFRDLGGTAFAVRRFDRPGGGRLHIEDFAQVLGKRPNEKYGSANYESVVRVLNALAPDDIGEFIRRLVFHVLSGNGDAHLKNWSLVYRDGRTARLSPAYDLVSTVPYIKDDALGLSVARTKSFDAITEEVFKRFADRAGLDHDRVTGLVRESVAVVQASWPDVQHDLPASAAVKAEIARRLKELPLAKA